MGCGCSNNVVEPDINNTDGSIKSSSLSGSWKLMMSTKEARKKFVDDGTLNVKDSEPGHLDLRSMLEDPIAQKYVGKYANDSKVLDIFMCWIDIQEFKSIPTENYRRSKALHIYHKYILADAVLSIGGIRDNERLKYRENIELSKESPAILGRDFFDKVQTICFMELYHNIYIPFKQTKEYVELATKIKDRYNRVKVNDFNYFNKLGEGGFGFVVHCQKKSTGKHYAMKIQTKMGLLDCFKDDPAKVDFEKQAFASCQHPFIVNLDYAFQTDTLAIMVLGLATAGDLHSAVDNTPDRRLSEERVCFYAAEVLLALSYMHSLGLIYRDLKPQNILLNDDGHIKLVDLGGVMDEHGKVLGHNNDIVGLLPLFAQEFPTRKANLFVQHVEEKRSAEVEAAEAAAKAIGASKHGRSASQHASHKKKFSVMGTLGYMAPEMVAMLNSAPKEPMYGVKPTNNKDEKPAAKPKPAVVMNYTKTVDWWSLGVTIYKLLVGTRPFHDAHYFEFMDMCSQSFIDSQGSPEYASLFQKIEYPSYLSPDAVDLISRLLNVDEKARLGYGEHGDSDIKAHPFFRSIDFSLLEQKLVEPPCKPSPNILLADAEAARSTDLKVLLEEKYCREEKLTTEQQKFFATWDFTSTQTIRVEAGLSRVMEQYDSNFKVRRVMGDSDGAGRRPAERTGGNSPSHKSRHKS